MRLFPVNWVAQMEARRLVLSLREMLVRLDENIAAHTLMQECVPYLLEDDPEIERAREEQALKVRHITDPAAYEPYYRENHHERPFEEQYGCEPEEAHERLHRVRILREWVEAQESPPWILDLAANDGWLGKNLEGLAYYTGSDLNPHCIARAKERGVRHATLSVGFAEDAKPRPGVSYDAVIAYELIEHVKDPDAVLAAMVRACKPGGSLFVSTPLGACTGGDLPQWWVVEPAGHVRAYTPKTFAALLARHSAIDSASMVAPGRMVLYAEGVECGEIQMTDAVEGMLMVARVTLQESLKTGGIVAADGDQDLCADRAGGAGDPQPARRSPPAKR